MLISHVRVMFDSQGKWSKDAKEQSTTIKDILNWFPHIVSRNQVLYYMMLTMNGLGLNRL